MSVVFTSCDKREAAYITTFDEILAYSETLPGEVYLISGNRTGLFMPGPGAVGNNNTSGSFFIRTHAGEQPAVEFPAVEGYYFETQSYINKDRAALYVVRKIPFPPEK